jgi:flagellar M-ring protein FliF
MNQLTRIWNSLSTAQRISLIVVPILVCAAVLGLIKWRHDGDFRQLSTGLAPEDAAVVTQKIREASIEYRLDETGGTVSVPSGKLAEARMALASAGLPKTGRIGFEIFDRPNFGTSELGEKVALQRALEGELEKTVATLSEVDRARIHLTFAKDSVFLDKNEPAKATVVLRLKRKSAISASNITAIANLVGGAVEGLAPESVAIIDDAGHLLNRPRDPRDNDAKAASDNLDFRRQVEGELLTRINAAIEPLVGAGRFHAGINVDCDFSSAEQSEELYDSSKSTILTSQTTEESTASGNTGGTPGTAANLPQPPPRAAGGTSGLMRRTENTSYQPGRTIRKTLLPKGAIRRISTSVLVDQTVRWEGVGPKAKKIYVQPSPEVLKGIHDVVAGITGFTETRGDLLTVETVPFESSVAAEPPAPPPASAKPAPPFNFKQPAVIGGVAGGIVLLLAAAFFAFRRKPKKQALAEAPQDQAAPGLPQAERVAVGPPESTESRLERQMDENQAEQDQLEAEALGRIRLPANTKKTEVLVKHIRESVQKDPGAAANVLRTWVADMETKRSG